MEYKYFFLLWNVILSFAIRNILGQTRLDDRVLQFWLGYSLRGLLGINLQKRVFNSFLKINFLKVFIHLKVYISALLYKKLDNTN